MLFTTVPELFNTQDYAEFHVLQMSLYAEFAPAYSPSKFTSAEVSTPSSSSSGAWRSHHRGARVGHAKSARGFSGYQSDLLTFLKTSSFVPLELVRASL